MKFASSIIALLAIGTSSVLARPTGPVAAPACICETVHGAVTELQTVVSGAAEKISALAPSDPEASISQLKDTVIPTVEGHVTEIIAVVQTTTTTIVGLVEGGLASKAALTEAQLSTLLADIEALKATIADIKSMAESDFAKFLCETESLLKEELASLCALLSPLLDPIVSYVECVLALITGQLTSNPIVDELKSHVAEIKALVGTILLPVIAAGAPVTGPLMAAAAPVTGPVLTAAAPVTAPVLAAVGKV